MPKIEYLFFDEALTSSTTYLTPDESRHCVKTLRLKAGDYIHVTDGRGQLFYSQIRRIHKNNVELTILEENHILPSRDPVHLAVSPLKSKERLEWLLAKVTEIGVKRISFVNFSRTIPKILNLVRLRKVAIAAIKQSHQVHLPAIVYYPTLEAFIFSCADKPGAALLAHCAPDTKHTISSVISLDKNDQYTLFIGPEGDFTPKEIEIIKTAFLSSYEITLGKTRLRSETAAIVAVYALRESIETKNSCHE